MSVGDGQIDRRHCHFNPAFQLDVDRVIREKTPADGLENTGVNAGPVGQPEDGSSHEAVLLVPLPLLLLKLKQVEAKQGLGDLLSER